MDEGNKEKRGMALMGSEGREGKQMPSLVCRLLLLLTLFRCWSEKKGRKTFGRDFLTYFHGLLETGARRRLSVEWSIQRLIERNRGNCFPSISREYGTDGQVSRGRQNFLLTMKNMLNVSALICNNFLQKKKGRTRTDVFCYFQRL